MIDRHRAIFERHLLETLGKISLCIFGKSIATSILFTGNSGPRLESELRREIRTADRIDFLISFIKFSGLRLIYDDLAEFTKQRS